MIYKFLRLSYYNCIGNYKKNLSLIGGVFASSLIISLFFGYIFATKLEIENEYKYKNLYGDFIIENPNFFEGQNEDNFEELYISSEQQNQIDKLLLDFSQKIHSKIKILIINTVIESTNEDQFSQIFAYDIQEAKKLKSEFWLWTATHGEMLENTKISNPITLGRSLAGKIGCAPTNPLENFKNYNGFIAQKRDFKCERNSIKLSSHTLDGQVNSINMNIAGLVSGGIRESDEILGFMNLNDGQQLLNTNKIAYYSIAIQPGHNVDQTIFEFNTFFKNQKLNLRAVSWKKHTYIGQFYNGTINFLNTLTTFIFVIMLILSFLCIFISLLSNAQNRSAEIMTFYQLGFKNSDVFRLYYTEYFILILISTCFSYLVHLLLHFFLKIIQFQYTAGILIEPSILKISTNVTPLIFYILIIAFLLVFMTKKVLLSKKIS